MSVLPSVASASDPEIFFKRTDRRLAATIDRPNGPDYQPAAIRNADGTIDVWFCGGGNGHDTEFHVTIDEDGNLLSSISAVIEPSLEQGEPDGYHTCHPAVVKHGYDNVQYPGGIIGPGDDLYYMYYECAPYVRDRGTGDRYTGPTEVCLAASLDGHTWMNYSSELSGGLHFGYDSTVPTPVVPRAAQIDENCEWSDDDPDYQGEYVATDVAPGGFCADDYHNYGSGHPSVVTFDVGLSERRLWLFYYDSMGDYSQAGMYLRKSWDGFHLTTPQPLVLVDRETGNVLFDAAGTPKNLLHSTIRYFDVQFAGHDGIFLAFDVLYGETYFAYSFDGLHWVETGRPTDRLFRMSGVRSDVTDADQDLCAISGAPNTVANEFGIVESLTQVPMLVGEGYSQWNASGLALSCPSPDSDGDGVSDEDERRGSTWGLYLMKGDFGHVAAASESVCSLYANSNLKVWERYEEVAGSLVGEILRVEGGTYYTYADEQDFLALNGNDPSAYLAISEATASRITTECPYGGDLTPPAAVCPYDRINVRKTFAPTKINWLEDGFRYGYSTWSDYVMLNYGDTTWTEIDTQAEWDAIVQGCPSGGIRQPTVCHTYDGQNVKRASGPGVYYVKYGNRYSYDSWCCGTNSYDYLDVRGNWVEVSDPVWNDVLATCPHAGRRGELNP